MTNSEIYVRVQELKMYEQNNLRDALLRHGGEYHFEDEQPIIAVAQIYSWEGAAHDFKVYAAKISDRHDRIFLYGYENGAEGATDDDSLCYQVDACEVFAGQMEFITDLIP